MSEIQKCPECECDIAQHNSERFYALHYNSVGSKEKCYCSRTYESLVDDGTPETEESPNLQLLIIDARECCFLKVENGRFETKLFDDDIGGLGFRIIQHPFTELREAIEQKPVPRIEQTSGGVMPLYQVVYKIPFIDDSETLALTEESIDALSELAGKPLPIYKGGEWKQVLDDELPAASRLELPAIWRYTK